MTTNDDIIKEEIDSILRDIIKVYELEGKKVTGNFPKGLEAVYSPNKGVIKGFVYLAGRSAGKMPPIAALQEWVKRKGIFKVKSEAEARSIAYVIARKIAKEGTDKRFELKVYEKVITPERIESIIDKIAQLNVNRFISEVNAQLEILVKNA